MRKFVFYNPTKILFGKEKISLLTKEITADKKIMLVYDGSMIGKNSAYRQIKKILNKNQLIEFSAVRSNPTVEILSPAIAYAREEKPDFLLAMGGGSVIDSTKFIAAAVLYDGDSWDILAKQPDITAALPFGAILTLPAAGSEMNKFAVISNVAKKLKLEFNSPFIFPKFAILDPELSFSVPKKYLAHGIADAFSHVIEQYITYPCKAHLQDGIAETILKTLISEGPKTLVNKKNYFARANVMWSAALAANELLSSGAPEDWTAHCIGLELSALYGLDHAQAIAIVLPAVLKVMRKQKAEKLLQYAEKVWEITKGSKDYKIDQAICKTQEFFESLGIKTRLSNYNISFACIELISKRMLGRGVFPLGERQNIFHATVKEILQLAL